jgi:hypothetical protein
MLNVNIADNPTRIDRWDQGEKQCYSILAYFMLYTGQERCCWRFTFPDSKIDKYIGIPFFTTAGDCPMYSSLLSPVTLITSSDYVWIAESLIPTHFSGVAWYFHQRNFDYLITYLITIHYYVDYLSRRSRTLKTEN